MDEAEMAVRLAHDEDVRLEYLDGRRRHQMVQEERTHAQGQRQRGDRGDRSAVGVLHVQAGRAQVDRARPAAPGQHGVVDRDLERAVRRGQRLHDIGREKRQPHRLVLAQPPGRQPGQHDESGQHGGHDFQKQSGTNPGSRSVGLPIQLSSPRPCPVVRQSRSSSQSASPHAWFGLHDKPVFASRTRQSRPCTALGLSAGANTPANATTPTWRPSPWPSRTTQREMPCSSRVRQQPLPRPLPAHGYGEHPAIFNPWSRCCLPRIGERRSPDRGRRGR